MKPTAFLAFLAAGFAQPAHAGPYFYVDHGHQIIPGEFAYMHCALVPNFAQYTYLQIAERYDQALNACVWAMPDWPFYWEQTDAVEISFPDIIPQQNLFLGAIFYAYWSCPGTYETHQLGGTRRRQTHVVEPYGLISTDSYTSLQCSGW